MDVLYNADFFPVCGQAFPHEDQGILLTYLSRRLLMFKMQHGTAIHTISYAMSAARPPLPSTTEIFKIISDPPDHFKAKSKVEDLLLKKLSWLCGSANHWKVRDELVDVARQIGIPVHDLSSNTQKQLCQNILKRYGVHQEEDALQPCISLVDQQQEEGCTLRFVSTLPDETVGAFGSLYLVSGFKECVRKYDPENTHGIPDVVIIKTTWAKYDMDVQDFPAYMASVLQEHYFTFAFGDDTCPNIVRQYGSWAGPRSREVNVLPKVTSTPWLAMQYYETGDSFDWVSSKISLGKVDGTLDVEKGIDTRTVGPYRLTVQEAVFLACSITLQMATGLAYIHSKGTIHGDFKLENCFVSSHDDKASPFWPRVVVGDLDSCCQLAVNCRDAESMPTLKWLYELSPELPDDEVIDTVCAKIVESTTSALKRVTLRRQSKDLLVSSALQRFTAIQMSCSFAYDKSYALQISKKIWHASQHLTCTGGTLYYDPPEYRKYPLGRCVPKIQQGDMWSLGASIYTMMTLSHGNMAEIAHADGNFLPGLAVDTLLAQPESAHISAMLRKILRADPSQRLTAGEIIQDTRLKEYAARSNIAAIQKFDVRTGSNEKRVRYT